MKQRNIDVEKVILRKGGLNKELDYDNIAYDTTDLDTMFLSADTSYYTETEVDANFLSADTSYYTETEVGANFLSGDTLDSEISTNGINNTGNISGGTSVFSDSFQSTSSAQTQIILQDVTNGTLYDVYVSGGTLTASAH